MTQMAGAFVEGVGDVAAFALGDEVRQRGGDGFLGGILVAEQGRDADCGAVGEDGAAFHRMLELARVARPVMGQQSLFRLFGELLGRRGFVQETAGQPEDVLAPLALQRNVDLDDI